MLKVPVLLEPTATPVVARCCYLRVSSRSNDEKLTRRAAHERLAIEAVSRLHHSGEGTEADTPPCGDMHH